MPNIPVTSPLAYIGVFLILSGLFFILTGSGIIKIEKLSVAPGKRTLIIGFILAGMGSVVLFPDIQSTFSNIFPPTVPSNSTHQTPTPVALIPSNYGKLLYEEKFDKDTGQWSLGRDSYIQNGELVIGPGEASSPSINPQSFSDFIFETRFRFLDQKSGFNVYLRYSYPLCLGKTGNCSDEVGVFASNRSVLAWQPNGTDTYPQLLAATYVPQLNSNDWNKLTVIANGSDFQIFINSIFVRNFDDNSTYKSGIFVMDSDYSGATAFDYVQIYELP